MFGVRPECLGSPVYFDTCDANAVKGDEQSRHLYVGASHSATRTPQPVRRPRNRVPPVHGAVQRSSSTTPTYQGVRVVRGSTIRRTCQRLAGGRPAAERHSNHCTSTQSRRQRKSNNKRRAERLLDTIALKTPIRTNRNGRHMQEVTHATNFLWRWSTSGYTQRGYTPRRAIRMQLVKDCH